MQEDEAPQTEVDAAQPEMLHTAEDPNAPLSDLSESQQADAERFAIEFLTRVIRLRGVRIDREHFLRAELHRRGVGTLMIDRAVAENPAAAGVDLDMLDRIASEVVEFETRKSTAMSFAAGIPGGFAMLGTIPGDITQFYFHAFRIMQKVAYVYGWREFLTDTDDIDDETLGELTAFLGVMMGIGGASATVTNFAANIARPAIQRQIAGVALTKTAWYTPMKQVLRVVGVKLTKDSFAKAVSKTVPVVGGVISGGLTYATLRVQAGRLIKHLRQLPPPNVDAEEYLRNLHHVDEVEEERASTSLRGRVSSAANSLSSRRPAVENEGEGGETQGRAMGRVKGVGSAAKGAAGSVTGRVGSVFARRSVERVSRTDGEA
ncbi:hypothetical protein ACT3SQ_16245 [Brachybacterium sp. AOP42-C2-15]|uniref:hypothetical protein n=1 Tax=Brachybacterium sp. AOP42-C2-15 TaxID=3457670 RepID=UPI004033BB5B